MTEIDFNIKCWYKDGCNRKTDMCQKVCHRYLQMNYLISNCGMKHAERFLKPLAPMNLDVDAFVRLQTIKDNIVKFVSNSNNLFISSLYLQTGKTTWALKLLYKFFDEIWAGNGFVPRGYFIYVPEFLNKTRSFQYKETDEFKLVDKLLQKVDLVIWDDITSMELTNQEQNFINMYIDKRYLQGKANIYTGMHLSDEEKVKYLGNKLSCRLDSCENIIFKGLPYKGMSI